MIARLETQLKSKLLTLMGMNLNGHFTFSIFCNFLLHYALIAQQSSEDHAEFYFTSTQSHSATCSQ